MSSLNNHFSESFSWSDFYNNPSDSAPSVPKSCSLSAANFAGSNAIPVIDMADPDALRHMALAFESWGAFQVIGHGVSHHVVENISTEARRFFSLTLEEKMKVARGAGITEGYGRPHFQSLYSKQFWSEGFSTKSNAKTYEMASKLWLDGSTFGKAFEEYRKEICLVSTNLVQMMLLSLGLTEVDIKRADPLGLSQKIPDHLLHLNWYPTCPNPESEMGLAHHTDSGIITMLWYNTTGLQVLRNEDQHGPARWVTVPLVPDSFIVLVGDLGHILSNGRFHSVMHRSMVNQAEPRLSVVYSWTPADNVVVLPLVSSVAVKPVFRAVTNPEFMSVKRKILYKATDAFKLNEVVNEKKKDDSASEVKEEKKVPKMDHEKDDQSAANLYKTLDSIKLVEVKEENKYGSNAPEVEEEKKNGSASEVVEENKMPMVEEEEKEVSAAGYL